MNINRIKNKGKYKYKIESVLIFTNNEPKRDIIIYNLPQYIRINK